MLSRAEAKKAHMERMSFLRRVDEHERQDALSHMAEPKGASAFKIAVSVANASSSSDSKNSEAKDSRQQPAATAANGAEAKGAAAEAYASSSASNAASAANKFRLLGDLPTLGRAAGSGHGAGSSLQQDAELALNLELHNNKLKHEFMKGGSAGSGAEAKDAANAATNSGVPKVAH